MSYDELRDSGIEYPASVISELELAGLPVERCYEGPLDARRLLGVRLYRDCAQPDSEPQPTREDRPATRIAGEVRTATAGIGAVAATHALRLARELWLWIAHIVAVVAARAPLVARAARRWIAVAGAAVAVRAQYLAMALGRWTSEIRAAADARAPRVAIALRRRSASVRRSTGAGSRLNGAGQVAARLWRRVLALLWAAAAAAQEAWTRSRPRRRRSLHALASVPVVARSAWQRRIARPSSPPPPPVPASAATERPAQRSRVRWLAPAALAVACAALLALTIGALSDSGGGPAVRTARAPRRTHRTPHSATAPVPARTPAAPATPVSPALAAQLEARGHELLAGGEVAAAVPVLQRALAATGENLNGCVEPVSETCLNYAYALYDLGRALRLDHQPAAAVLILERRLRIANQQAIVQSELALARQEAGQRGALTAASG